MDENTVPRRESCEQGLQNQMLNVNKPELHNTQALLTAIFCYRNGKGYIVMFLKEDIFTFLKILWTSS